MKVSTMEARRLERAEVLIRGTEKICFLKNPFLYRVSHFYITKIWHLELMFFVE